MSSEGLSFDKLMSSVVRVPKPGQEGENKISMSTPKISVNKLGEYVQNINPLRRRQIVYDAKFPAKFRTTRYTDAREFIKNYIINGYDESILIGGIESIGKKPAENENQENVILNSIAALELMAQVEMPDLSKHQVKVFEGKNTKLVISGVEVSVYPDLIIETKSGTGGVKLHLSKTFTLLDEGQKTVATVLKNFIDQEMGGANNDYCFSVDVFAQTCQTAPTAYKQRMRQVEIACEEIALWWSKLIKVTKGEKES